jgi:diacylglycerol O-acyltransferase / wax synthase
VTRLPQRTIVTVATNVPGPRQPLYVVGRRILEILPYVPIAIRMRTGIAALSYCDQLTFGLTLDYDSAPEVDLIGGAIADGLAELLDAARAESARTVGSRRTGRTARVRTTARRRARTSVQSVK